MQPKTYRAKVSSVDAMQLPVDDRKGDILSETRKARSREMAAEVRDIAVWMVEQGYEANPTGEDLSGWMANDVIKNSDGSLTALPECGTNYLTFFEHDDEGEEVSAHPGDYIVKSPRGYFYRAPGYVFENTYEEVN